MGSRFVLMALVEIAAELAVAIIALFLSGGPGGLVFWVLIALFAYIIIDRIVQRLWVTGYFGRDAAGSYCRASSKPHEAH